MVDDNRGTNRHYQTRVFEFRDCILECHALATANQITTRGFSYDSKMVEKNGAKKCVKKLYSINGTIEAW